MQVTWRRLLAHLVPAAAICGLAICELPVSGGHQRALAAVNLGCTGQLTVAPTSGTFSASTASSTTVTLTASGLDKNPHGTQVFLAIYDDAGRSATLIPLGSATVDANGNYSSQARLPAGGIAGGTDQIVVADQGPSCAVANFTVTPTVSVSPAQGYWFSFNGSGFRAGATIIISFAVNGGSGSTAVGSVSAGYLGGASGMVITMPASAPLGAGTLQFSDGQGTASAPFTNTGVPPTATPCPGCPTSTAVPTNTTGPGGGGTSTNTPGPTFTFVPFPTSTVAPGATSTSVPFATNTPTPRTGGATATSTPQFGGAAPSSTPTPQMGFPSPTSTVLRGFPSPTPTVGKGCRRFTVVDGDFSNGLICWSTNVGSAVTVQPVAGSGGRAARVTAKSDMVVLSQSFIGTAAIRSITFAYQNLAKPALAQLSSNGQVLVGRRLLPSRAATFVPAVLPLPDGLAPGSEITVAFTAQKGTLLVRGVGTSAWPSGSPPPPAPKPKPKPKKK